MTAANPAAICRAVKWPCDCQAAGGHLIPERVRNRIRALEADLAAQTEISVAQVERIDLLVKVRDGLLRKEQAARDRAEKAEARWVEHDAVCPSKELVAEIERLKAQMLELREDADGWPDEPEEC